MDVCVINNLTLPRIAWLLVNVWRPGFIDRPWIEYRQGKSVELRPRDAGETVYLQIDGDPAGALPARFEIADWQINMVIPGRP